MTYENLITLGQRIRIIYKDGGGEVTERVIDIDRIYACTSKGRCLITAFCHRRGEYRTFDASRILVAMPDDSTVVTTFGQMRTLLPYTGATDSASRLAGWS